MKLSELLKYVKPIAIVGNAEVDITGVNIDSRKIEKGHLFVAIKKALRTSPMCRSLQQRRLWVLWLLCSMASPHNI